MSWEQYISIIAEAKQVYADELAKLPECCPWCATDLDAGPDGTLHCPFDGWTSR